MEEEEEQGGEESTELDTTMSQMFDSMMLEEEDFDVSNRTLASDFVLVV